MGSPIFSNPLPNTFEFKFSYERFGIITTKFEIAITAVLSQNLHNYTLNLYTNIQFYQNTYK